jgi:hypothetical protein
VAHIEHNTIKRACDDLPFDVEWVIVKTYSHFYRYTCRAAELKKFCEEASTEYNQVLGYAKTRFLLCLPGTNSSVERLFSSVNVTWTESKTRLKIETLKAILIVKCNFREDCIAFYRYLQLNSKLLDAIASKEKYMTSTEEDDIEMVTDNAND